MNIDLETTNEERARLDKLIESGGELSPAVGARLLRDCWRLEADAQVSRDFMAVSDKRAEGLAKEVERLKAAYQEAYEQGSKWIERALAAEAKLAVYEAPIGDGEVEKAVQRLDNRAKACRLTHNHVMAEEFEGNAVLIRRLSAAHAECTRENTKLREALEFYADPLAHGADGTPDFYDEMDFGERARAALAPASEEKAT